MGISKSMKDLTKDIQESSKKRTEDIARIKDETNVLRQEAVEKVKSFSISRDVNDRKLRQDLEQNKTDRRKDVKRSRKEAQGMTRGFHDSRLKGEKILRKDLLRGTVQLAQNEKKRKEEVVEILDTFHRDRLESIQELKKDLAEGQARIKRAVGEILADTRTLINDFQSSRQTMGSELKNELARVREAKITEVENMRDSIRKTMAEVQTDLKEASNIWKEMDAAVKQKTRHKEPASEVTAEVPAEAPAEASSQTASEISTEVPAEMQVESISNLEEKCLSVIAQHPEGISLADVARELGVVTIVLGKAAKVLLEEGKVRREERNYFPVMI
ncbi:MAG: hypothetical protein JXA46_16220 [Dehalococcoidales bacterium]|nr:hypothetical protein [Dehalococcoidales bacterium]